VKGIRADGDGIRWDAQAVLKVMVDSWQSAFKFVLGHAERAYVGEMLDVRNKWAHGEVVGSEDVYRALDTAQRLLESISEGDRARARRDEG
jgi:hypothetical protein